MATFSVNQVRHFYVVKDAADFGVSKDLAGNIYFTLKDADGEAERSDLLTNIMYSKATIADALARKTKVYKISMASGANCVEGEDYIVGIRYTKFISQSDEDTYHEVGAAKAEDTTVGKMLLALAKNLAANTEKQGMVSVSVLETATEKTLDEATAANVTAILVKEIEQPWSVGVNSSDPVCFTVSAAPAKLSSAATSEGEWAKVEDATATYGTKIGDGKKLADLEYFALGDRADIYRKMGWPSVWPSDELLLIDPTKEYDVLDIHYAYVGSNHAIQKSEKDITIACPVGTDAATAHKVMANVIAKINSLNLITIYDPADLESEE